MTEFVNPFDSDNFRSGGGLWDDKVVTIVGSSTTIDLFRNSDGTPWLNDSGEQGKSHVWAIVGIAEDEDKERRMTYSIGNLIPTHDGEGFTKEDGTYASLHKTTGAGKFAAALKASGFDVNKLFVDGKPKVSALIGAQFRFKGVERLNRDGSVKMKNNFPVVDFYPTQFIGYKAGSQTSAGNGATQELKDKAYNVVSELLNENGGSMKQADLVRALSAKLGGGKDTAAIAGIITREDFYTSTGITRKGTTISL